MGSEEERRSGPHADALCAKGDRHRGDDFCRPAREVDAGAGPRRSGARAHDHSRQRASHQPRADVHRGGVLLQDQFQHWQFGDHVQYRRRAGEASLLRPLRRRHPDGSLDRRRHSAHPAGHHRRFADPHRDRADLRSAEPRPPRGGPLAPGDARSHRRSTM